MNASIMLQAVLVAYRYVVEYAEEIYKSGLCFEEWLKKETEEK